MSHPAPVQSTSAPAPHARAALASLGDGVRGGGVMSTVEAKRPTPAGRRAGYVVAAVHQRILLWLIHVWPGWDAVPS